MTATNVETSEVHDFIARARTPKNEIVTRKAKAARAGDVTTALLAEGLVPLSVSGGPKTTADLAGRPPKVNHRALVITTRMMAVMFEARLDVLDVLTVAIEDCDDITLRNALIEVRAGVASGLSMSEAMAAQAVFPPVVVTMIASGEASADLKGALLRIANEYDSADRLRAKIKKATIYPAIVAVAALLVITVMVTYIMPKFAQVYIDIGGPDTQLPWLTRMVLGFGSSLIYILPVTAIALAGALSFYRANKDKDWMRERIDPAKFRLPVFGRLYHRIALARFCRTLSNQINSGVERLSALEAAAKTVGHIGMERAILRARDAQSDGLPLVDTLREEPLFHTLVIQMVQAGERSSQTGVMLGNAADIYDRDVETITDNMSTALGPLMLALILPIVGVVAIAMFLPYVGLMGLGE